MTMRCTCLAIALLGGACGQVDSTKNGGSPDAGSTIHDAAAQATVVKGMLDATKAVTFGGPYQGVNYCYYQITLKQLAVTLTMNSAGNVTDGSVQDLNSESVVQPCTQMPIPANIAVYTLQSATANADGQTLAFTGTPANVPQATLVATLTRTPDGYSAAMQFMRVDNEGPFNWAVSTTVALAAQ